MKISLSGQAKKESLVFVLRALLSYAAFWCCLGSLGALGAAWVLPVSAGAAAVILIAGLHGRAQLFAAGTVLIAAAVIVLAQGQGFPGGCALYCNRLMEASARSQRYLYEYLDAGSSGMDALLAALLPCGLLAGALFGLMASRKWLLLLPGTGLALLMAWLGLSPQPWCLVLLALSAVTVFAFDCETPMLWQLLPFAALAVIVLTVALLFPGEDAALHTWSEDARDRVALQTVAYGTQSEQAAAQQPEETERPMTAVSPSQETSAELPQLTKKLLPILAVLLLLFVPAALHDRLRRRRALACAGLGDPDCAVSIRASFQLAVRWLELAGLTKENEPYSHRLAALQERFPALAESYRAALPLWQLAAYGERACTPEQRAQMSAFLAQARDAALAVMPLRRKIAAKLLYGGTNV